MRSLRHIAMTLLIWSMGYSASAQTTWYVDDDCTTSGSGTEIDPFCAIQDGVNASSDDDTVLVKPGTYIGDGNRDISLFGKTITLKSIDGADATTIDIQGGPASIHRGFFLVHGETSETLIEGFTITNGYLIGDTGGSGAAGGGGGAGIYIRDSSPTIRNCIVRDNFSATLGQVFLVDGRGGGVYVDGNSHSVIKKCIITGNSSQKRGAGLYVGYSASAVSVLDCLIYDNHGGGGTFYNTFASTAVANTAIVLNGDAIGFISENSPAILSNCILWGNVHEAGVQLRASCPNVPTIEHSDLQGGFVDGVDGSCGAQVIWGPGNIDADPLFFDPDGGDYRLLSGSPCIDAGNNLAVAQGTDTDLDGGPRFLDDPSTRDTGNPDPDAPRVPIVDMGPYEYDPNDCNNNDVPDEQDLESGTSADVDENGIPDECQADCNNNGIPDSSDVAEGFSVDCNGNGIPEECEEDPALVILLHPQDVEVAPGDSAIFFVLAQGLFLEFQWRKDGVDLIDDGRIVGSQTSVVQISEVGSADAGQYDCVVTAPFGDCTATTQSATLALLPACPADVNDDGVVGPVDLAMLLAAWGPCADPAACPADLNADGAVGPFDLATLLAAWGPCP